MRMAFGYARRLKTLQHISVYFFKIKNKQTDVGLLQCGKTFSKLAKTIKESNSKRCR